ncbi:MAG: hypothetical protein HYR66_07780 [Sphingobacteriales bacterium]|nr:hypothetical protein [Sphingobacteriales bacterium]MBI3719104.1 hypothetical protein [Sphingobacteriales bacterium]
MKLLIITSISEDLRTVSNILEQAEVAVFSVSETIGHKTEHHNFLPDNWFGKNEDGTNALFFFSFTEDAKAVKTIELVKQYNAENNTGFPIRAFMSPVELSSY